MSDALFIAVLLYGAFLGYVIRDCASDDDANCSFLMFWKAGR